MNKMLPLFLVMFLFSCGTDKSANTSSAIPSNKTKLIGHIENYSPNDSLNSIVLFWKDPVGDYEDVKVSIDSAGNFDTLLTIPYQKDIGLSYKTSMSLILNGGETLEFSFDGRDTIMKSALKSFTFKGPSAKLNENYVKYLSKIPVDGRTYYQSMQSLGTAEFIRMHDSVYALKRAYTEAFLKENELSSALKDWIYVDQNYAELYQLLSYRLNLEFLKSANPALEDAPDSLFNGLGSLAKVSQKHLINSNLSDSFTNYYTYYIQDKVRDKNTNIERGVLDSLVKKEILDLNKDNMLLAQLVFNERLNSSFGNNDIKDYEENLAFYEKVFKDSPLDSLHKQRVVDIKELLANPILPAKAKLLAFETEDTSKYLEEIIANANGKVIYVDNWATWCAPCKMEFKNSTPALKEKFEDEVEFVYLCFRSKEELYKPTISEFQVEGKHYYVPDGKEEAYFDQIKLKGFPTYLIINKEGEIVKNGFEYRPSFPETTEILTQLVAK